MSVEHPQRDRDDDLFSQDFAAMFNFLNDQVRDPHLDMVYENARNAADYLNLHKDEAAESLESLVNLIDQRWNYINEILTVTAPIWVINSNDGSFMGCVELDEEEVKSRGFTIRRKVIGSSEEELENAAYKPAHYVHLRQSKEWPEGGHGVIFIDDIKYLELPYPSEAMRAKNLTYQHPEIVSHIDSIVDNVGRPDQLPKALADLVVMADTYAPEGVELLSDVAAYLNIKMKMDIGATYRMEVEGPMIRLDDDDNMFSFVEDEPTRLVTDIQHISLFPRVEKVGLTDEGIQPHGIYINLTTLESDPDKKAERLMIPSSGIRWICSSRYDRDMPPTYLPKESHD